MRAVVVREVGVPPRVEEWWPEPEPGDGEALVEVLAVPLNPVDIAVGAGRFYGGHPPVPFVAGCECIGRVADSGEVAWVNGAGLGTKRDGTLAERVAAPKSALAPIPNGADPVLAGALGIAGLAGWLPLAWRAPLEGGETVLVLGATGAVGLVAVQAAKIFGAGRVVAAGRSAEGLERAREAGADETVRLGEEDSRRFREACGDQGADVIIDPLWGKPLAAALDAAARGARVVNIGQSAGPETTITSANVRGKELEILGYSNFGTPRDIIAREYRRLVELGMAGDVRLDVERVPFEDAPSAWERQAAGGRSKLVIVL
jgi:NADPH:quinone reductase